MHPFALNQTATALVTGGTNVTTPNDGKALIDRKIGVKTRRYIIIKLSF